jgi:hypothetical protein
VHPSRQPRRWSRERWSVTGAEAVRLALERLSLGCCAVFVPIRLFARSAYLPDPPS